MITEPRPVEHEEAGTRFESLIVAPQGAEARPAVLIFPTIMGRSDLELGFARRLAAAGHAAMVADLYGRENIGRSREECRTLMDALRADRPALQARLLHALDVLRDQREVDPDRVAAIGYCFGGLCALDLARTGADLNGVASFHGILTPPGNLDGVRIAARVIAFHGWDDPLAPPADVTALGEELTRAGADWQLHAYGHTAHGFTNPGANDPDRGLLYNPAAEARSWKSLMLFLDEIFG
ncbi:dienelactone hydrolase family protein [Sphingosinicella sp. CPCC 101087]|uniref:dienelactone hydrolase family protein n=1 Tax=Sphingosinicella sp. CPCC 101087 TaxID=2497754 RepID=UPI00101D95FF|nr:dienelactone hydrolase family protein [Sphingosinicella sp. CPCC 101087]